MTDMEENNIIETVDENGEIIRFQLFDIIEFEEKEYALLLPEEDSESEDSEMVLMLLVKDGEDYSFETIEDEDEFERVSEYIESLGDDE